MLLVACLLASCATIAWYGQAVRGQFELLAAREKIRAVRADPGTPPEVRRKLGVALSARDFAVRELALPDNGSYTHYVDLDREAVVWNVVATPELDLEPKRWCYPVAGCLSYRGFFRKRAARRLADRLAGEGMDVRVSPVAAYSTLGRFRDPVTEPMLAWGDARLAGLIFHELAHQRVFVPGDTAFNEAYAQAVQRHGVERFLADAGRLGALARWRERSALQQEFVDLLLAARADLVDLYASELRDPEMRRAKRERLERLSDELAAWIERRGADGYEHWLERSVNNADLALLATYELGTDAFSALLAEYDGDFARFHRAVDRLADGSAAERARFLNRCRTPTCP
ncbi:MAG: aminopeptidase [Wenzhouxiangellaceae bacterium]|nr:aminopeptidase [Wenzhouxiangellaceae bacterium]